MNKFDYYFRQRVLEGDLDWSFEQAEDADLNIATDFSFFGITDGFTVSENSLGADVSVDITSGVAYTEFGNAISNTEPSTNVDCSTDEYGISTAVATGGNEKWISVFARFTRLLLEPQTDGNGLLVYTKQYEDFEYVVRQGAEATIGTASRPAKIENAVLLADINLTNGSVIQNSDISLTRRDDFIRFVGSSLSFDGNILEGVEYIYNALDSWTDSFTFSDTWHGSTAVAGSSPPPTNTVEALDAIVYDLSQSTGLSLVGTEEYDPLYKYSYVYQDNVQASIEAMADDFESLFEDDDTVEYSGQYSNWLEFDPGLINFSTSIYHPVIKQWLFSTTTMAYQSLDGQYVGSSLESYPNPIYSGYTEASIDTSRFLVPLTNGAIYHCTDIAGTWTSESEATIGGTGACYCIGTKYPSSDYTIVARNSVRIASTGVGGGWAAPTTGASYTTEPRTVTWLGGSTWLLLGSTAGTSQAFISTDDGDNWAAATHPSTIEAMTLYSSAYNSTTGRYIAVGGDSSDQSIIVYTDNNGTSWSKVGTIGFIKNPALTGTDTSLFWIKYLGDSVWVAGGNKYDSEHHNVMVSFNDGLIWNAIMVKKLSSGSINSVITAGFDGKQVVAAGAGGVSVRSLQKV